MKKESLIIALGSSLVITGIMAASYKLLSISYELIANFVVCSIVVCLIYYFAVGRRLKSIHLLIAKNPSAETENIPSLQVIETRIKSLLRERKEELEKIEKLERHRREFLDNVSHEMKTPLFHIQGYVSTLVDNAPNPELGTKGLNPEIEKRYLENAEKSVERIIHILEDLDTISQLESKEISSDIEPFDIVELAQDVLESEEINAAKKNITLTLENEMEKAAVIGDRFRIRQVILNLVVNSIRYGKNDGKTTVKLKNDPHPPDGGEGGVLIEVIDNGIGIAKEHLPRLFERFYRVDKGRSREHGGTGLGLSIVKHILESHHQTIQVSSTAGEGSTFSFHLKKGPHHSSFQLQNNKGSRNNE